MGQRWCCNSVIAKSALRFPASIKERHSTKEVLMRWIYIAIVIFFVAATVIFALQNFEIVTVSLVGFDARVPLALLVAIAYLVGAATGGSLFALLRRSYAGSR